jgi:nucleotide-binding universal stress UspA family protein
MFKHILMPTDGSTESRHAVASGIRFAKDAGAGVVGVHVIPMPHLDQLEAWTHHDPNYVQQRQALFDKFADAYLAFIADMALAAGVPCICEKISANDPAATIVKTAEYARCDLIWMASHGWKGNSAQLLGSQTVKVLHLSKIPVLVHQPGSP